MKSAAIIATKKSENEREKKSVDSFGRHSVYIDLEAKNNYQLLWLQQTRVITIVTWIKFKKFGINLCQS